MVQYCFRLIQIQFHKFHSMFPFIRVCISFPIRIFLVWPLRFPISNLSSNVVHYYEMGKAFKFELIGEPLEWMFAFCKVHSNKQIETTKTLFILSIRPQTKTECKQSAQTVSDVFPLFLFVIRFIIHIFFFLSCFSKWFSAIKVFDIRMLVTSSCHHRYFTICHSLFANTFSFVNI